MKGKATATVSGRTIAETDEYEVVEGNVYVRPNDSDVKRFSLTFTSFHPRMRHIFYHRSTELTKRSSVNMAMLSKTDHTTHCPWKGDAAYYTINLDSETLSSLPM